MSNCNNEILIAKKSSIITPLVGAKFVMDQSNRIYQKIQYFDLTNTQPICEEDITVSNPAIFEMKIEEDAQGDLLYKLFKVNQFKGVNYKAEMSTDQKISFGFGIGGILEGLYFEFVGEEDLRIGLSAHGFTFANGTQFRFKYIEESQKKKVILERYLPPKN